MEKLTSKQLKAKNKVKKQVLTKEQKIKRNAERMKILNPQQVNLFNIWKKYPKKVIWMFVSAFLYNVALTVFLKKAATIASGTSSLAQIITFTAPSTAQFYGLFYVLVNLPLMFIFWKMNPRMFMVLTYYWMLFQVIIQCIFIEYSGRGSNPIVNFINQRVTIYNPIGHVVDNGQSVRFYWDPFGIDLRVLPQITRENYSEVFTNAIFLSNGKAISGSTSTETEILSRYLLNLFSSKDLNLINHNVTKIFTDNDSLKYLSSANIVDILRGTNLYGVYNGENWPVLVYAILGGAAEGFASIVAWRQRGSIGGTSVISNYIAYKNKKPVGNVFLMVAICFSSFSTIVIGSLEFTGNIRGHVWNFDEFLVRIMGTIVYLLVFSMLVNKFYPKYKKVKIDIYTKRPELVAERFKKIGYIHSFNIFNGIGGYSHDEFGKIETVALYLERDQILDEVKRVDKNAWITISNIHGLIGEFDTSYVD
ncbi:YitT family protein [Metamycoplasma spumans]|uniref:YitT family protein n=1 Tax=Metamycoplasma spumans TaxID=92406 RepID=UPI0034DD43F5